MASTDYSEISDAQSSASTTRGVVTSAVVPIPNGGGSFVMAAHSLTNSSGVVASYSGVLNFAPTDKGGEITGGLFKGGIGGSRFSSYCFVNLNGQSSTNSGYILGLSDSEPAHLILRKGSLATGLPDVAPGTQGVLRRSTATFALDTWVHVKLEAVLEPTGDVVLNVYQSDLAAHAITSPVWVAISGMASVTDDALQIVTGSDPLSSGYMGYGGTFAEINRIAAWDQIVPARQLLP